jgi:antitoxin CptB
MTHDSVEMARLRWRCRRGLLEMDVVLGRFVPVFYPTLDEAQKIEFDQLLDLTDTTFWDKLTGKEPADNEAQQQLLDLINAA